MNEPQERALTAPGSNTRGFHTILEWTVLVLFPFSTACALGYNFTLFHPVDYLFVIPLASLGYFLSDILTGFVHFLADLYGSPTTPIIGPNFIEPFRWHHAEPQAMCKHNLAVSIGNSCMLAIPVQIVLMMILYAYDESLWIRTFVFILNIMTIGTVLTNLFHKWAHENQEDRPKIIIFLQKYNLILSEEHHAHHHTPPHESYFCVTNGWANALLEKIGFWKKMEWILRIFGLEPDITSKLDDRRTLYSKN